MLRCVTSTQDPLGHTPTEDSVSPGEHAARPQTRAWSRRVALGLVTVAVISGLVFVAARGAGLIQRIAPSPAESSTPTSSTPTADSVASLKVSDLPAFPTPAQGSAVTRKLQLHTTRPERPRVKVTHYTVKQGDTLFDIADKYGLEPETILWGNYESLKGSPESLEMDQELNILPVDGAYYQWQEGDSIRGVAGFFRVDPEDILDYPGNNIAGYASVDEVVIDPGTWLIVPGGKREVVTWQAPRITRANPAVANYVGPGACSGGYDGPVGEPTFIWPTTLGTISGSTYSSFHPAIDIAGAVGNAVYASASGVVVYAGWNDWGYGYMIVLDHGNGWQTLYAHLSGINVGCGQGVAQGRTIGAVGSTGNSTGAHLHFEMQSDLYGKVNPLNFVSP
jgi:murein DD-endopeptidase MepM/ murein hydrolase activator NlpD